MDEGQKIVRQLFAMMKQHFDKSVKGSKQQSSGKYTFTDEYHWLHKKSRAGFVQPDVEQKECWRKFQQRGQP